MTYFDWERVLLSFQFIMNIRIYPCKDQSIGNTFRIAITNIKTCPQLRTLLCSRWKVGHCPQFGTNVVSFLNNWYICMLVYFFKILFYVFMIYYLISVILKVYNWNCRYIFVFLQCFLRIIFRQTLFSW